MIKGIDWDLWGRDLDLFKEAYIEITRDETGRLLNIQNISPAKGWELFGRDWFKKSKEETLAKEPKIEDNKWITSVQNCSKEDAEVIK